MLAFSHRAYRASTAFAARPRYRGTRCVNWASPLSSRLAKTTGRIEFTCVTDETFTSGCSPPRLAATQLPSVTKGQTPLDGDLHPAYSQPSQAHYSSRSARETFLS